MHARHFVAEAVSGAPQDVRDAVEVMVSEIAANCVVHAATGFDVRVEQVDDHLRIEVTDSGVGDPVQQRPQPNDQKGRGLLIVDALADEWGVVPTTPQPGKTVWFTLRRAGIPRGTEVIA